MDVSSVFAILTVCVLFMHHVRGEQQLQNCDKCKQVDLYDGEGEIMLCKAHYKAGQLPSHTELQEQCGHCEGRLAVLPDKNPYYIHKVTDILRVRFGLKRDAEVIADQEDTSGQSTHMVAVTIWRVTVSIHRSLVIGFLCNVSHSGVGSTDTLPLQPTSSVATSAGRKEATTSATPETTTSTTETPTTTSQSMSSTSTLPTTTTIITSPPTTVPTTTTQMLTTSKMTTTSEWGTTTTESSAILANNNLGEQLAAQQNNGIGQYGLAVILGVCLACCIIAGVIIGALLMARMTRRRAAPNPDGMETGNPVDNPVYFSPQALTTGHKTGGLVSFGSNLPVKPAPDSMKF